MIILKNLLLKTTSKIVIEKVTAEETGDLIENKIADKITEGSRGLPPNSLEAVESKTENIGFNREMPKERYTYPEKIQLIME